MALTCDGKVYTWGWGVHGQLGHRNAEDQNFPKLIESVKKKIISICAGQGHSVLLSKYGDVYTFGCGMFGQLGTGTVLKQSQPLLVNIPERIKLITSGYFHVLAVSRINKVYTWGCNPQSLRIQAQNSRRARQHGTTANLNSRFSSNTVNGSSMHHRTSHMNNAVHQSHLLPNLLNTSLITDAITEISCGSHHSVALTSNGEVYSWGRNSEGQIGNGTRKEQKIPTLVIGLKERQIEHISCGADFSVAVDISGKIFGWGQNDSSQLGLKPTIETNAKHNSGSSGGRVITIRTNRRMITITQPCRQSVLRPIEIVIPFYEVKSRVFDSGSFENEYSMKIVNHELSRMTLNEVVPELSKLDNPSYGPHALHAALKIFHHYFDFSMLLNHCLNFGNFQAAAKLCALENFYDQALDYHLKALLVASELNEIDLKMALYILDFYTNMLDIQNENSNQKFLNIVIQFWMQNNLEILPLESFFQNYYLIFSYPLSVIISQESTADEESEVHQQFINHLSPKFCLDILYGTLTEMQQGCHLINLVDEMVTLSNTKNTLRKIHDTDTLTDWDDSIPQERLWMDIMHNLQTGITPHSSILVTTNNIDFLAKSLISEKFYIQSFNNTSEVTELNFERNDVVIFSCGHYYTLSSFHTSILQLFKESMLALVYPLPLTVKFLLSEYQEDIITIACPKCVITEISNCL